VHTLKWIYERVNAHTASLPKTKAKLRAAIKPMCSVQVQHMEVSDVLKRLEEECYFQAMPSGKVIVLKKKTTPNDLVSRESYRLANEPKRDPAKVVFARCKEWMEAPLNKPSTLDALRRSLAQLCVLKEEVDPDHVVKLLEAKGCISIDLEDKVTYL
jgi:hypothetical protein